AFAEQSHYPRSPGNGGIVPYSGRLGVFATVDSLRAVAGNHANGQRSSSALFARVGRDRFTRRTCGGIRFESHDPQHGSTAALALLFELVGNPDFLRSRRVSRKSARNKAA